MKGSAAARVDNGMSNRVIFSGKAPKLTPEAQIIRSEKPLPGSTSIALPQGEKKSIQRSSAQQAQRIVPLRALLGPRRDQLGFGIAGFSSTTAGAFDLVGIGVDSVHGWLAS